MESLVINMAVVMVVLESDLGKHRKVSRFRLARPLVTALAIVPIFIKGPAVTGAALALELLLTASGVAFGLLATSRLLVYRSAHTGRPVSQAGWGYASIWVLAATARVTFSYGSVHWFPQALESWMRRNDIAPGALTDAMIFMALAMVLTRVAVMGARAQRLGRLTAAASSHA